MGINLLGSCLASCREIVQDIGATGPVDKAAIKVGMINLSSSMEQSRKELSKRQKKRNKKLRKQKAAGKY